jgi:hypothetical protein
VHYTCRQGERPNVIADFGTRAGNSGKVVRAVILGGKVLA